MKLLFDHNLSQKLVRRLSDIFPDSTQTSLLGLGSAPDLAIWRHAKEQAFTIVTRDSDFCELSWSRGVPPKIVWLRCGNSTVGEVEDILRRNASSILELEHDISAGILEIWA